MRLIGAVLLEDGDERQLQHRSMQAEGMAELASSPTEKTTPLIAPHAACPMATQRETPNSTTAMDATDAQDRSARSR